MLASPATTFAEFLAVLPHVDRLNSWVRSESAGRSSGRMPITRVIYHFKNEALKAAIHRGIVEHRRVATTIVCRDCNGSKRYTDYNGYTHPWCRLCGSTGSVRLQFIETTLRGYRWHSPVGGFRHPSQHFGDWENLPVFPVAEDWRPHLPGRDLTPSELAESMNVVEAFFPARPPKRWVSYDSYYGDGDYTDDFAKYTLHVGSTPEGGCSVCYRGVDDPSLLNGFTASQGRITWTATVCSTCRELWGSRIWDRLTYTGCGDLLTPEIREWIALHPVAQEPR